MSVFVLCGLWQREYLVDKTAWWTEQTWQWKYNTGFNWLFAGTGTVLQDKLEQVVRVDEIDLALECNNFFPFRRNFFCFICPRLTDPSKPLKALCHTFYGQWLLFWVNGFSWGTLCQLSQRWGSALAQPLALIIVALLCRFLTQNTLSWSLLQYLYHSTGFFFIDFSLFMVIKVKCKVLNPLVRNSLTAVV